jgi:pimeloyl-ACP methyl ester carboxylesterase
VFALKKGGWEVKMPTIKLTDIECYYEIHGQGKTLVLIAGLGSDSQSWEPALTELAKYCRVVVFDNRGIGRTKCSGDNFDINILAKDTIGLMDALGVKRADILGHSMGGYIAQEMAINYSQRINKLILASTAACTCERNKLLFRNMLSLLKEGIQYELFLKEFLFWIFTPEFFNNKEKVDFVMKYLLEYPYPITLDGFRRQVEALNKFRSLDRVDKIRAETLVITGRDDILIKPGEAKVLSDKISNGRLKFLENAAHAIHMEETESFINCVLDFLR